LGFLELQEDDVPDELIWHHDERMKEWWDEVRERRKAGSSGRSDLEDVPTTDNEMAEQYR
jgi:hypothetical protein